jgi:hypothetical protein
MANTSTNGQAQASADEAIYASQMAKLDAAVDQVMAGPPADETQDSWIY